MKLVCPMANSDCENCAHSKPHDEVTWGVHSGTGIGRYLSQGGKYLNIDDEFSNACDDGCIIKGEDVSCISVAKYRKDKIRRIEGNDKRL